MGAVHLKLTRLVACFSADAHRRDGKKFIVTGEKLTAFLELERITCESLRFLNAE
jgi:hypothetical protein